MTDERTFHRWLRPLPLVAILRGVEPVEVESIAEVLVETGLRIVEVPLNSPQPLKSIEYLARRFGDDVLIGAGTVLHAQAAKDVAAAGGRLIVMPHADEKVVAAAKSEDLFALPGFATPTEALRMLDAGADALKLFPAEANPPVVLKAIRAILPATTAILPVGGITPERLGDYLAAGAAGFGLGSALYKPGMSPTQVRENAERFCQAIAKLLPSAT